jgi:thiamine-phosphate pyrophosphorylase
MTGEYRLPRFYPILDTSVLRGRGWDVIASAQILVESGARILQYRHKDSWTEHEWQEAKQLADLCRASDCQFVLNDRADFAKLLGAGLHVGQDDLPPIAARKVVGSALMGFSTHNQRQLTFGNDEQVDYLSIGPIYVTFSKKKPDPVIGLAGLKKLSAIARKPLVAIGGIGVDTAAEVLSSGANSVAVISGFLPQQEDLNALRHLVERWMSVTAQTASTAARSE